jgi:trk system potassium uptake protein TrkA
MAVKRKSLSVLVIGLGNFGANVAREMARMNHIVIAIDKNEDQVQAISDHISKAIIGDATKKSVLESIGAKDMDLAVVSLGDRIDNSALATLYLQELGINEIWVKVVSEDHAELIRRIGTPHTIFPERDMAIRVAHKLSKPNIVERLSFSSDLGILEFKVTEKLEGKSLVDLNLRRNYSINVIGQRESRSDRSHLSPDPTQPLIEGDILFLLGTLEDLERFQEAAKQL